MDPGAVVGVYILKLDRSFRVDDKNGGNGEDMVVLSRCVDQIDAVALIGVDGFVTELKSDAEGSERSGLAVGEKLITYVMLVDTLPEFFRPIRTDGDDLVA